MSHMDLGVNGPGHPKKDPLGQESEAYKRRQLESKRGIDSSLNNVFFI